MSRRTGLTEKEILKELSYISPAQSEIESGDEDEDCAEGDNDCLDEDFHCSSDSAESSFCEDEEPSSDLAGKCQVSYITGNLIVLVQ